MVALHPRRFASPSHREAHEQPLTNDEEVDLLRNLEASDRFVKDTGLGRMFHPGKGKVSYREAVRSNSLHIVVHGRHMAAHIDTVSPLVFEPDGTVRYSLAKDLRYSAPHVVAHNLVSLAETVGRWVTGQGNAHRCELVCERVDLDDAHLDGYLAADESAGHPETPHHPFNVVDEAVDLLSTGPAPWSVQLEVRVAGRLDPARLQAALAEALRRHPRGHARRRRATTRPRRYEEWELTAGLDVEPLEAVDCPDDAALSAARARLQHIPIPIEWTPPVRARLAHHPDGDVVMLNLSHVATDGVGGLRLLRSIARAYQGMPDPLPSSGPLTDRTLPVRLARAGTATRLRRYLALAERGRDLIAPPARIAAVPGTARKPGGEAYRFHHVALEEAATSRLVTGDRPGSVNDVLLAALHLAIEDWNARHGRACRRITVLVPSNLRPPRWREEVMGNFSVPARITTTPRHRTTPAVALDAVVAQTRRKKPSGLGTALLQLLDASKRLPLPAKRAGIAVLDRVGSRLVDTVVLSNLGTVDDPPSFGDDAGEATELWFSAPTRMPLGVSIGAMSVAGRLHLAFRADRRMFDDPALRGFADAYLARLREMIDADPAHPAPAAYGTARSSSP